MVSHDASGSAIGYIYQVRWALLELIRGSNTRPDMSLTLERFDDVAWEDSGGNPTELLQLKHHKHKNGSLTDKSADLWRTLKVWMDDPRLRNSEGPELSIVTTATAPSGSAAALLRDDAERNVVAAAQLLEKAARSSTEKLKTAVARAQWLKLTESERLGILQRVHVLDNHARIEDLDAALEDSLWLAAPQGRAADFLAVLDAWWLRVSVDLLRKARKSIRAGELKAKLDDIRDGFQPDNLITTVPRIKGDEVMDLYGSRPFVHQLQWIDASPVMLTHAVADFHRAVAQTTHWVDRNLIEMSEFDDFKDALADEWELAYDDMMQDLPDSASDEDRSKAGNALYRRLRDSTAVQVRPRYTEVYYARGIRHELADGCTKGWHPDFEQMVKTLTIGAS
ncbi:ABC-three component system protein [Agromyces sp. NPDC058136]|uniref:ABC-three component system protein n=1 Tax=Agromyces sp. NPDC058136 TaxID=3346354 RepID=UPI0036DC0785